MDINPEREPSPHEQVPPLAPEAGTVTVPTTTITVPRAQNRRRYVPFALVGVLTIGVGLAAFFAVSEDAPPSKAVASALTNSLQFRSAATTTSIEVTEAGGTATVTSEGVTNFDTAAATQVVHIVSGSEHIVEHLVSDGSIIYVHLDGGIIAKVVPGKSWLSIPSGQPAGNSLSGGGGASNEAATLKVLSATGNDVFDLGSSRVNGQAVHLYSVHLTRSEINRDIAEEHPPCLCDRPSRWSTFPPLPTRSPLTGRTS
jgi:hypothetical protein